MVDAKTRQASREGRVNVSWWTTPELRRDLKVLAATTGREQQELLDEALRDLLVKSKKRPKPKG